MKTSKFYTTVTVFYNQKEKKYYSTIYHTEQLMSNGMIRNFYLNKH